MVKLCVSSSGGEQSSGGREAEVAGGAATVAPTSTLTQGSVSALQPLPTQRVFRFKMRGAPNVEWGERKKPPILGFK